MARESKRFIPGSAIQYAWELIKNAVGNQRGEVGDPGEEAGGEEWDVEGNPSGEEAPPKDEAASEEESAEGEESESEQSADSKKPEGKGKPKQPAEAKKPEEEESDEGKDDLESQLTELKLTHQNLQAQLEFFQKAYNEMVEKQAGAQEGQEEQQAKAKLPPLDDVPEGILKPGDWEDQDQMARYFDHRANIVTSHAINQALQPMQERIGEVMGALQEAVIKQIYPDYDEVAKDVWDDIFILDNDGKVQGVKNQGLLEFIRKQPFSQMAVYKYGTQKRAPQKIKEGIQNQTRKTLEKVGKKPKGPTQPAAGAESTESPSLDWNTPKEQAEKILDKDGLL